jgi:hypothetical protein
MAQHFDGNPKRLSVSSLIVSATEGDVLVQTESPQGTMSLLSSAISLNSNSAFLSLVQGETGGGVILSTLGSEGSILLQAAAEGIVSALTITPASMLMAYGMPGMIGSIQIGKGEMLISMGVPDVGPTIAITTEGITFKVGETVMTLTAAGITNFAPIVETNCGDTIVTISAEGINEVVAEVTRQTNAQGHNFTAAETEMNVGAEGIFTAAATSTAEAEASSETSTAVSTVAADAMQTNDAALIMDE